jgi:hypothetical protein
VSRRRLAVALAGCLIAIGPLVPATHAGEGTVDSRAVADQVAELGADVAIMQQAADEYAAWRGCISRVPVVERGQRDGAWGYRYDERDGSGAGYRPALAVDPTPGHDAFRYDFLEFADDGACRSDAKWPGHDFRAAPSAGGIAADLRRLRLAVAQLTRVARRFDAWESCVVQVPVTEYGDPDGEFGFVFHDRDGSRTHRSAIAIDRSPWDDPDHFLLAFVDGDRPGGECHQEPGEAVDRRHVDANAPARPRGRPADGLPAEVHALTEDVEDLREPIGEFSQFDQCMYTVGASRHGRDGGPSGYVFRHGVRSRMGALAFDGARRRGQGPQLRLVAFPGEEPPSIECDEDAGEEEDDD